MKKLFLMILFVSFNAYADKYSDQLKQYHLKKDLKAKEGFSNLREEIEVTDNLLEERTSPSPVEETPLAQKPSINQNPGQLQQIPEMTKEQASELGKALKEAQKAGLPVVPVQK